MNLEAVEQNWAYNDNYLPENLRDQLIVRFTPLVRYLASRVGIHLPNHVEIDDLVSFGIFGLIDALNKFDPSKNVKFKTYAELRIRGAIYDSLRELDWIPRSVRRKQKDIELKYRELEQMLGHPANDEEIAKSMNLSITEFHEQLEQVGGLILGIFKTTPESGKDED